MYRQPQQFKQPIARPKALGPEFNPWFWNPNNVSAQFAPDHFRRRLWREMDPQLDVTWNPINQRWQVWARSERMQNPVCRGWRLLFIHNGPEGEYLPLDERVFARLLYASADVHGSAKAYFDRIASEYQRDREKTEKKNLDDQIDMAMPYFEHSQIKVSGFGKSNGNKFATYHQ